MNLLILKEVRASLNNSSQNLASNTVGLDVLQRSSSHCSLETMETEVKNNKDIKFTHIIRC